MLHWPHLYGLILICATLAVLILTPLFGRLAVKLDLLDRPGGEKHKQHGKATPLLGGMAMFCGWLAVLAAGWCVVGLGGDLRLLQAVKRALGGMDSVFARMVWIVVGAAAAVALGLLDDRKKMAAQWKFLGQFGVALIAVLLGNVRISLFITLPWLNAAITVFWFMTLMNAINFFDNMDGLAAGTATIAFLLFALVGAFQEQFFVASLASLCAGTALGFWFYNSAPASIFMGDSGSHFLGYLLAAVSASATYFTADFAATRLPVLIPLFILAVPLFDTAAVTVIRTAHGKPFWIGDHNHISHRFVKLGLSRKRAVQLVHLLALLIGLSSLPILWGSVATSVIICIQTVILLTVITIFQFGVTHADTDTTVRPDAPRGNGR